MLCRISAFICIIAIVAGCGGAAPDAEPSKPLTQFVEAVQADAVNFHPYLTTDSASSDYQGMVYTGGFMRRNEDTLELVPNMAESWTISDDGLTYVFTLREDMLWSDGEPLTAFDFVWTFEQVMNPEHGFPYIEHYDFIKFYAATGEYEITITLTEQFCPALESVDFITPLPWRTWRNLPWSDVEKNPEILKPTITSGPYKLVEWDREDHIIFEANDLYWKGRPKIDRYIIRIIPEQGIAYIMLESGEVDRATLLPSQYKDVKDNPSLSLYEWWAARGVWYYLGLNQRKLTDLNVRRAINYAMPKGKIIDTIMAGRAQRQPSTLPPTSAYYNPNVPFFYCDPDKANQILDEAGYPLSGKTEMRDDFPKLMIVYGPHSNKTRQQLAVIVQSYLKAVGIDSEIQAYEWSAYLEYLRKSHDWDISIGAWAGTMDPHGMQQVWSSKFPDLNHIGYDNPNIEAMFDRAAHDCEHRAKIYDDIQYILAEDCPYVFLFQTLSFTAINKRVQGIKPTPLGIGYNIHEWYIEE